MWSGQLGLPMFRVPQLEAGVMGSLCAMVWQEADRDTNSTTLYRKRSGVQVKTPYLKV